MIILCEVNQTEKNVTRCHLRVETKKKRKRETNELIYKTETGPKT